MSQDLPAQRPAVRTFGRVGGQQVRQPVLLALGLFQVLFQLLRDRAGLRLGEPAGGRPASMSWP